MLEINFKNYLIELTVLLIQKLPHSQKITIHWKREGSYRTLEYSFKGASTLVWCEATAPQIRLADTGRRRSACSAREDPSLVTFSDELEWLQFILGLERERFVVFRTHEIFFRVMKCSILNGS